jgi:hypothetical protein
VCSTVPPFTLSTVQLFSVLLLIVLPREMITQFTSLYDCNNSDSRSLKRIVSSVPLAFCHICLSSGCHACRCNHQHTHRRMTGLLTRFPLGCGQGCERAFIPFPPTTRHFHTNPRSPVVPLSYLCRQSRQTASLSHVPQSWRLKIRREPRNAAICGPLCTASKIFAVNFEWFTAVLEVPTTNDDDDDDDDDEEKY